jgi:hypothetical protein
MDPSGGHHGGTSSDSHAAHGSGHTGHSNAIDPSGGHHGGTSSDSHAAHGSGHTGHANAMDPSGGHHGGNTAVQTTPSDAPPHAAQAHPETVATHQAPASHQSDQYQSHADI